MDDVALSVVIASHNAEAVIDVCLRALEAQTAAAFLEVIVADSSSDTTAEMVSRGFPSVRLLHFEDPLSVPVLRGRGIAAAHGAIIAILDPFSVAAPDWAAQVIEAHSRQESRVIGGPVDLYRADAASYTAWATYLNEYGLFMSPVVRGATWILPGSNLSYKRHVLFEGDQPRYPVFSKTFVNWDQEAQGSPLWLEPAVRIELHKPIAFSDFLRTRYEHGRCFAGMRTRDASMGIRLGRAVSTILVPLLQLWRWTSGFWPKGRKRGRFVATLPAQCLLFVVWSVGEAWGYLGGTGRACDRIHY